MAQQRTGACRYEIEYSLKRGSSDNCYLLQVRQGAVCGMCRSRACT